MEEDADERRVFSERAAPSAAPQALKMHAASEIAPKAEMAPPRWDESHAVKLDRLTLVVSACVNKPPPERATDPVKHDILMSRVATPAGMKRAPPSASRAEVCMKVQEETIERRGAVTVDNDAVVVQSAKRQLARISSERRGVRDRNALAPV